MKNTKQKNKALDHALLMAGRNMKSYVLLSVTMIMSFSLLLGFFVWTDSSLYNKYKHILCASPYVGDFYMAYASRANPNLGIDITNERYSILIDRMEDMEETYYFWYYESSFDLPHYDDASNSFKSTIYYVPNDFFGFYERSTIINYEYSTILKKVNMLFGESGFKSNDEVIIDKFFYDMLYNEQQKTALTVDLPVETADGVTQIKTFRVVGVCEDTIESCTRVNYDKDGNASYVHFTTILMPQTAAKEFDGSYINRRMLVYSKHNMPEIFSLVRELNIGGITNRYYLDKAQTEMNKQVFLKGLSAIILFSLLGINLYSCFKNALNERRFEIGVKRAVGARKKDIIGQFFREGMIVMCSDIATAVYAVFGLAVIYKAVQRIFFDATWTIYLSPYSAVIFLLCAFFLSVSFSLIFAYQSATVEIASQLKAE